jgi:hypothetical protein
MKTKIKLVLAHILISLPAFVTIVTRLYIVFFGR